MRPVALLLAHLLLLQHQHLAISARYQQQQQVQPRWRPLERATECGSEFHDVQSKWLQSDVVVRATWRSSNESKPNRLGIYNVTLMVLEQLKPWRENLTNKRILVGKFKRTETGCQKALERQTCVPCRPQRSKRHSYLFFLKHSGVDRLQQLETFRHAFLPIRFKKRMLAKFTRLQCRPMQNCQSAPVLLQEARIRKGDQQKGRATLRIVCRASGLPQPKPMWLKDGVRMEFGNGTVAQFRNRNRAITTRLILKNAHHSDAGNYTCVFSNFRGTVNSSISVADTNLNASMGQLKPPLTSSTQSPFYLCNHNNYSYCHHGGTCYINKFENTPECICPAEFSGSFCERINIPPSDFTRRALALSQAAHGAVLMTKELSVTGALLIMAVVAVFVVLIIICCLVLNIRRRLDQNHWKNTVRNRSEGLRDREENDLTGLTQAISRAPAATESVDASTMTDEETGWKPHHRTQLPTIPPPSLPLHQQYRYYLANPVANHPVQQQQQLLLSNGPTSRGRSRNSSGRGGGGSSGFPPPAYTYRSPGHSALPPVHIRPVFDYGEASPIRAAAASSAAATPMSAGAAAAAPPHRAATNDGGGSGAEEQIDLLREFNRIEWLQRQQLQEAQPPQVQDAPTEQDTLLPSGERSGRTQQQQQQPQQPQPVKQRPGFGTRQLLPFPGHGLAAAERD